MAKSNNESKALVPAPQPKPDRVAPPGKRGEYRKTRQPFEKAQDYAMEAKMYLQGQGYGAIAAQLNLGIDTVRKDLQAIQRQWLESANIDFDQMRAEQLAKIDAVESEMWQAWEKSKTAVKRTTTRQVEGGDGAKGRLEAGIITYEREGNIAFLNGILGCIEQRCKLLGLNAPDPSSINMTLAKVYVGVDLDQM